MICGSYGRSMLNFVTNHQNVFQSGSAGLHFHQQCMKIYEMYENQHLVFSLFQILAIPAVCITVSHCCFNLHFYYDIWYGISFYMLICHCISSLVKWRLRSLVLFFIGLLFPYCWVFRALCLFWIILLHQICLLQIFSVLCCVFLFSWHCISQSRIF